MWNHIFKLIRLLLKSFWKENMNHSIFLGGGETFAVSLLTTYLQEKLNIYKATT